MSTGCVLVVGDVMTDIIVVPEGALVRGSDRRATIRSKPGGSGANQAVWLGSMGTPVRFLARVGEEDLPRLSNYLAGFGVEPVLIPDAETPSGTLVTIVDPDGERSFYTDRGANLALSAEDLPQNLLEGVTLLLVSGYALFAPGPRAAALRLIDAAKRHGIDYAVDAASVGFLYEVGTEPFLNWIRGASLLFCNRAEALALTGADDIEEQMRHLGAVAGRVVIKLGPDGAALGSASGVLARLPAREVEVLDTTGAGDAFAAGFISADLRGAGGEEALAAGIEAASSAIGRIGGQPG